MTVILSSAELDAIRGRVIAGRWDVTSACADRAALLAEVHRLRAESARLRSARRVTMLALRYIATDALRDIADADAVDFARARAGDALALLEEDVAQEDS